MRSLSAPFAALLAGDSATDLASCVEILSPVPVRRTDRSRAIVFQGETYTPDTLAFGEFRQDLDAGRVRVELTLQNLRDPVTDALLPWTSWLAAAGDVNGTEVRVHVVSAALDAAESQILEQTWEIDGYGLSGRMVRFALAAPYDALVFETPSPSLGGQACLWTYKQGACTSESAESSCPKTLDGCVARFPVGAVLPFGPSFPFMDRSSRRRRGS